MTSTRIAWAVGYVPTHYKEIVLKSGSGKIGMTYLKLTQFMTRRVISVMLKYHPGSLIQKCITEPKDAGN
jgi:phenylacetate-coenzyme A ligase PaaK-like adenylate-forming protein